jgi:hypothetical protein
VTTPGGWRACEPILLGLIHDLVKDLPAYTREEAAHLVSRVAAHLDALPAYQARPLRLYLRAFDLSALLTRRRRFARLDPAEQGRHLRFVEGLLPLWGTVMQLLKPIALLCYFDCFPLDTKRTAA